MDADEFISAVVISFIFGVFFTLIVVVLSHDNAIRSKTKIQPDLEIEFENGVADTTYVYRLKN